MKNQKTGCQTMDYTAELSFFCKILHNFRISSQIFSKNQPPEKPLDLGLRDFLYLQEEYERLFCAPWDSMQPNTVYTVQDAFLCNYIFLLLPETDVPTVLVAGPYMTQDVPRATLMELAERRNIPPHIFSQIEKYYSNIPVIAQEDTVDVLFFSLGETLWGDMDKFTVQNIRNGFSEEALPQTAERIQKRSDDTLLAIQMLEMRYETESRLLQAVSQGMTHKAEQLLVGASKSALEMRTPDALRNSKNYCIIMNTLLRKAAEHGAVHPYYIDSVSSAFAKRIERAQSAEELSALQREMVHTYCHLVKKHSAKQYSPLVQKVLTVMDSDLTADLSLRHLAALLNVNASYLSALFKKETDKTVTEFVTAKRMEYAAYLLRTTKLQIQTVAQHCGIYDVNYFTKMFKKFSGKTPREFRESVL